MTKARTPESILIPWWLNEVYWQDKMAVPQQRSVDVFDIHAYPDGPDTSGWTQAQLQALSCRIYRDYWDPTYVSESGDINQYWTTFLQPNKTIPFRLPRMRAIANMIYPGTPLSVTEWSANFAGESDFSTALADADAYGILGRERAYLASRWVAPVPGNPNYLALKLYRNYDGHHSAFQPTSMSAANNGNPDLFSSYSSLNSAGNTMTAMILNKDPSNIAQVQFAFNGFTPSQFTSYTLSSTDPTQIVPSAPKSWTSDHEFRALHGDVDGDDRIGSGAGRGVGLESRHDSVGGRRTSCPESENHLWLSYRHPQERRNLTAESR